MPLLDKSLFLTLSIIALFMFIPKQHKYSKYNTLIITFLVIIIYLLIEKWELLNLVKNESFQNMETNPTTTTETALPQLPEEEEMEVELVENKINKNQGYDAIIVPSATKFWIKDEYGYFDIGNANTERYILGDSSALRETGDNYTMEMWLRPYYFGNPYLMTVSDGVNRQGKNYFSIMIDEENIFIEDDMEGHKIPYVPGEWMQLTIVRGTVDRLATDIGRIYKNGTFLTVSNKIKLLNKAKDGGWLFFQNPKKLGLENNQYLSSNPNIQNRASFGVFRLYNRSLSEVEIKNNFDSLSGRYRLFQSDEPMYIKSGLICDLDAANPDSYPGNGNVWYDISKKSVKQKNKNDESSKENEGKSIGILQNNKIKKVTREESIDLINKFFNQKDKIEMTTPKPNKSVIKQGTDLNKEHNIGQIVDSVSGKVVAIVDKQGTMQELESPMTPLVGVPVVAVWKTSPKIDTEQTNTIEPSVNITTQAPMVTQTNVPITTQAPIATQATTLPSNNSRNIVNTNSPIVNNIDDSSSNNLRGWLD